MDAFTIEIIISIALAVACLPCGAFLGFIPMKADRSTTQQTKASQMMCFVIAIAFIGLLVAGRDMETWAIVLGLLVGFVVAKIPAINAWALGKWPFLKPVPKRRSGRR